MRSIHGETTNNKAYYIALIEGLESTIEHGVDEIVVFMNSQLIVDQMTRHFQVTSTNLIPLCDRA
jgi:ribonuclease HI